MNFRLCTTAAGVEVLTFSYSAMLCHIVLYEHYALLQFFKAFEDTGATYETKLVTLDQVCYFNYLQFVTSETCSSSNSKTSSCCTSMLCCVQT
jgi:hypothetical protein